MGDRDHQWQFDKVTAGSTRASLFPLWAGDVSAVRPLSHLTLRCQATKQSEIGSLPKQIKAIPDVFFGRALLFIRTADINQLKRQCKSFAYTLPLDNLHYADSFKGRSNCVKDDLSGLRCLSVE